MNSNLYQYRKSGRLRPDCFDTAKLQQILKINDKKPCIICKISCVATKFIPIARFIIPFFHTWHHEEYDVAVRLLSRCQKNESLIFIFENYAEWRKFLNFAVALVWRRHPWSLSIKRESGVNPEQTRYCKFHCNLPDAISITDRSAVGKTVREGEQVRRPAMRYTISIISRIRFWSETDRLLR